MIKKCLFILSILFICINVEAKCLPATRNKLPNFGGPSAIVYWNVASDPIKARNYFLDCLCDSPMYHNKTLNEAESFVNNNFAAGEEIMYNCIQKTMEKYNLVWKE